MITIASAAVLLFLVMDPLGNIPLFVSSLSGVAPERLTRLVVRELLIAYGVLLAFLFAGRHALHVLHISEPALSIAGGVILLMIAVRMVFPSPAHPLGEDVKGEPFIVPLAVPYVAGPGVLATLVLLTSREPDRWPEWLAALTAAWAVSAVILLAGSILRHYIGPNGLIALERLMGMVLVTIAVQMFLTGVQLAFPAAAPRPS